MLSGGGAAEENVISSEVEGDRVEAGVGEANHLQRGAADAQSLSSGSSIELLDIADEGQDHATAESQADERDSGDKLVETVRDGDRQNYEEMDGMGDGTGHFVSAAESESLTSEQGQVAVVEPEVNTGSRDTVATMPSVDEEGSEEQAAETDGCDECHESLSEDKLQQSTMMSSATDRTATSELPDNILGDVARFDILNYFCCFYISLL